MSRRRWTDAERALMRDWYPCMTTAELAEILGRRPNQLSAMASILGLHKRRELIVETARARMLDPAHPGRRTQFCPGHVPANKGIRGWQAGGRSVLTRFRPGNRSARWDPEIYAVGALRINSDGGLDIKVREGLRAWVPLSRWVWERAHGPIPPGHLVRARNGDLHDTQLANLYLATRLELMRENTLHRYPKPLARLIQTRGALIRQIRRAERRTEEIPA